MSLNPARILLELQAADIDILRAEKRLEELPEKLVILEIRAKIREARALLEQVSTLQRRLASELKARQDEIATLTAKIETEQAKIMETSDHRRIQALTREVDGLRRRVDKLEMESLQYMERSEKARAQSATVDAHLKRLAGKESELIEKFRAVGGAVQEEISRRESERARLAAALPADLMERYTAVRESKGGIGVGRLDGSTCSACHMTLPAERVRELTEGPDVGLCPQCRRLIVVRTEGVG